MLDHQSETISRHAKDVGWRALVFNYAAWLISLSAVASAWRFWLMASLDLGPGPSLALRSDSGGGR